MDKRYKTDTKTWAKGMRVTTFAIEKFIDQGDNCKGIKISHFESAPRKNFFFVYQ